MLTMTQAKDIRKMYFEEGKNISEIARETGHDRKTVRGYLDKDNWNEEPPKVKKEAAISLTHTSRTLIPGLSRIRKPCVSKGTRQNEYTTGW